MPVFDRFRLVLKSRHRPFRIFWNFEKIFIELGDTAPQISKNSENFQNPRQPWLRSASGKCSDLFIGVISCHVFFLREISELSGSRYLIFGTHHRMYLIVCQKFYFLNILSFSIILGWFFEFASLKKVDFLNQTNDLN